VFAQPVCCVIKSSSSIACATVAIVPAPRDAWFREFDPILKRRDLDAVRQQATPELIDAQDEDGMTALHFAVAMNWADAMPVLLELGANPELRHHRTGSTPLLTAVTEKLDRIVRALLRAGSNADAANFAGLTPRKAAKQAGLERLFVDVEACDPTWPPFALQNAEHLADHYHPRFRIPGREEREQLAIGQAVEVHVHGPKQPRVKIRIFAITRQGASIRYRARIDPPDQDTNVPPGTIELEFGPEHVATVFLKRPPA
jgi:hypothetical protein